MNDKIINGELCKQLKRFKNYHISKSGRIYRTVPIWKKEEKLLLKNPDLTHFHEVKKTDTTDKSHKKERYYLAVTIKGNNGKPTCQRAAALVAETFNLKKKTSGHVLRHKDGNYKNIEFDNLYYQKPLRSLNNSNYKLTKKDVVKIKTLLENGLSLKFIGDLFGVSDMQIYRIKSGENWNNGKILIEPPKAPFYIDNPKIRRYISIFDSEKVKNKNIIKPFYILRNKKDPTDNLIIGIVNGYKFKLKHKNITRAKINVNNLNNYFFKQHNVKIL